MNKNVILIALTLSFLAPLPAAETVRRFMPSELRTGMTGAGAEFVPARTLPGTPFDCVKIANPSGQPLQTPVLTVEKPPLTQRVYAISGLIRYQGVEGRGFLEMWSHFAGGKYFSRTLAETGPMSYFSGDTEWRPIVVPFFSGAGSGAPEKIVLNLVLPARGTVFLGELDLRQYKPTENPLAVVWPGAWWGDTTGGWIGGLAGLLFGLAGAVTGWLTARGRARRTVMVLLYGMLSVGLIGLLLGGLAIAKSQPYAVYYPLGLVGFLLTVIPLAIIRPVKKRYQALELQRMASMDLGG